VKDNFLIKDEQKFLNFSDKLCSRMKELFVFSKPYLVLAKTSNPSLFFISFKQKNILKFFNADYDFFGFEAFINP